MDRDVHDVVHHIGEDVVAGCVACERLVEVLGGGNRISKTAATEHSIPFPKEHPLPPQCYT